MPSELALFPGSPTCDKLGRGLGIWHEFCPILRGKKFHTTKIPPPHLASMDNECPLHIYQLVGVRILRTLL